MRSPEEEQAIRARSRELRERAGAGEWPPHGRPARRPGARPLPGLWCEMEVEARRWFVSDRRLGLTDRQIDNWARFRAYMAAKP